MKTYDNLRYAQRAGSNVVITCTLRTVEMAENRRGVQVRRLEVTDGHTSAWLVLFGSWAGRQYRTGSRVRAGPVYWSEQWGNFALARGGTVTVW